MLEQDEISLPGSRALALQLLRGEIVSMGWKYWAIIGAVLGFGAITLLPAQFLLFFTESAETLSKISAESLLSKLLLFGVAVGAALLVSEIGNVLCQEWLCLRLGASLRRKMMSRLQTAPLTLLDGTQRGDWIARVSGDLSSTEFFLTDSIPAQLRQLAILIGSAILFFYKSGVLGLVPLVSAVTLTVINMRVQKKLSPVLGDLRTLHGGIFQLLLENIEGVRTIRSHGVEPYVQRRFEAKLGEINHKSMLVAKHLGVLIGGTELAGQLMITACLTAIAWGIHRGQMTLSDALVYPFFISLFYGAAHSLAAGAYEWNRFFNEGGRVAELLFHNSETPSRVALCAQKLDLSRIDRMKVEKVSVGHEGNVLVRDTELEISTGSLTVIKGPSGCGKSTFLEVLAGIRPGIKGQAALYAGPVSLWQGSLEGENLPLVPFAYVEQRPYIFEGTLRENLTFGNPNRLSDTRLWEALERASLYETVRSFGGLDYFLRDRGMNLSEGERYRIALCRALLLNRPFLLLDEPFAALDDFSIGVVTSTLNDQKLHTGICLVTHYVPDDLDIDQLLTFRNSRFEREAKKAGRLEVVPFPSEVLLGARTAINNTTNNLERGHHD